MTTDELPEEYYLTALEVSLAREQYLSWLAGLRQRQIQHQLHGEIREIAREIENHEILQLEAATGEALLADIDPD